MNTTKYVRKGKSILDNDTGKITEFESINAAKAFSKKIQIENSGRLGNGCVKTIKSKNIKLRKIS